MRILIVGGAGMLGHRLLMHLSERHDVRVTLRREIGAHGGHGIFRSSNAYERVDACSDERLRQIVEAFRPEAIVNAVGIVKQLSMATESIPSIEINSLLPHRLARIARVSGARLVHFSTDCVFSGRRGHYSEEDRPDPEDLYGHTKLLGEVADTHALTLRVSLIGHELERHTSLLDWFLAQKGTVKGFRKAIFSGFTTIEMARIVEMLLTTHPDAHGVWHVSSAPIDKFRLLNLIKKHYAVDTEIMPDDEFRCDRSLDSTRFRERFAYEPPSWESMIAEMSAFRSATR